MNQSKELKKLVLDHSIKWKSCKNCSLGCHYNGKIKKKILCRGKLPAKYLFIGEAPSTADSVLGIPLTGESGSLFDKLLHECFVTDYAVTNLVACYPAHPIYPGISRSAEQDEIDACKERLSDFIEICMPSFYISLGKTAKQNPPDGVVYHLHLDHPLFILRNGGYDSLVYKRNRHNLRDFIEETR